MKTLYESILNTNSAGAGAELDEKLDKFDTMNAFHIFDANVTYDFFCKWLDQAKFNRLCIRCLKSTRKKRGQYDYDDWMNIVLTDGVLLFRFSKDKSIVSFRPMLANVKSFGYYSGEGKEALRKSIPPQSWPVSGWTPEKQLEAFYHYFEKNKDEVKKRKP